MASLASFYPGAVGPDMGGRPSLREGGLFRIRPSAFLCWPSCVGSRFGRGPGIYAPAMKKIIFAACLLCVLAPAWSRNTTDLAGKPVELTRFGVAFRGPKDWFTPDPQKLVENLRKFDIEKENLDKILTSHRGSITVATYLKHDPRGHQGVIPTINVIGRRNPDKTFDQFRQTIATSAQSMASVLQNFVVKTEPAERTLSGRRVVFFAAEYDVSIKNGGTHKVATTTYAIPCGDIFLQVSMIDTVPIKHAELFGSFIHSFTFKHPNQGFQSLAVK
jgi:hypothetical protein